MEHLTTVFIADGTEEFCTGLSSALAHAGGFQVVGTANDGETALRRILDLKPQALVLDLMLSKRDGISILHLNKVRCAVRNAELAAVRAFYDDNGSCLRPDILILLNRMSSMVYILMIRQKAAKHKGGSL